MWILKQKFTTAKTALIYITVGALTVIWTAVWYVYLFNNPPHTHEVYYWCTGLLVTGLIMVLIGLILGWLGRSSEVADLTPQGASPPSAASPLVVVNPSPNVAAPAAVAAPASPVAVGVDQEDHAMAPPAL